MIKGRALFAIVVFGLISAVGSDSFAQKPRAASQAEVSRATLDSKPAGEPQSPGPDTATCPVEPLADSGLSPEVIGAFANRNRLSLSQTICCLPANWRRNYVVASTSPSAQSAGPQAPRIILFPPTTMGSRSQRALSFLIDNSENKPRISEVSPGQNRVANQRFSIEMRDEVNGRPRYSEIRFESDMARELGQNATGHRAVVSLNEQACTTCHGPAGQQYPTFSFAPTWNNTFPKLYKPTVCPTDAEISSSEAERGQLVAAANRPGSALGCLPDLGRTIQNASIRGNRPGDPPNQQVRDFFADIPDQPNPPRGPVGSLASMDPPAGKGDIVAEMVADPTSPLRLPLLTEGFEVAVVNTYNTLLSERIRAYPNYSRFKYAMAGALIGCWDPVRPNLTTWFGRDELERQNRAFAQSTNPLNQNPLLNHATTRAEVVRDVSCSGPQSYYQQNCFPASCPTADRLGQNISDRMRRSVASAATNTPGGNADANVIRSISHTNLQLRRNWVPVGAPTTNGDPDAWGAFRYIMQVSAPGENIRTQWNEMFNPTQDNHRSVNDLGQQLISGDPELSRLRGRRNESPCNRLAQESVRATAAAPINPVARNVPATTNGAGTN